MDYQKDSSPYQEAQAGDIGQALLANQSALAQQCLKEWMHLFPDRFYIELQRMGHEHEEFYIHSALGLASKYDVPVVATNDVRFLVSSDYEAHEARVCIHGGWTLNDTRRQKNYTEQQYLRSPDEMAQLFADIPESLINTVEIAKRCNFES